MVRARWDAVYAARAAGSEFREVEAAVSLALLTVLPAGHLRPAQACRLRWDNIERHGDGTATVRIPDVQPFKLQPKELDVVDVIDRSVYGAEHVLVSRKRHPLLVRTMTRRVQELARRAGISAWRELSADYISPGPPEIPVLLCDPAATPALARCEPERRGPDADVGRRRRARVAGRHIRQGLVHRLRRVRQNRSGSPKDCRSGAHGARSGARSG